MTKAPLSPTESPLIYEFFVDVDERGNIGKSFLAVRTQRYNSLQIGS